MCVSVYMASFPCWKSILFASLSALMIAVCARSLLNRNLSLGLRRELSSTNQSRTSHPPTTRIAMSSADLQAQVDALQPPTPLSSEQPQKLPKLSPADYRTFNRVAVQMDAFHNHFRATWNTMYHACENNKRPSGMSIRQFLGMGLEFCHHLTMHHTIEERYVFPELAVKMPLFRQRDHLLGQHAQIHVGLEEFEKYLAKCRSGETELRMGEMKQMMDGFGKVLWTHLDDEVEQLGAENMRKFWTKDEMSRIGVGW